MHESQEEKVFAVFDMSSPMPRGRSDEGAIV